MLLYQNYAKEILSKLHRISEITGHGPSIGTYHENIVRNYLENFLPDRYSIKTGFVHNHENNQTSPQIDILIIDEMQPSVYLFKDKDFVIVSPQSVACAIEIKTNFDKKSFLDIASKAKQYRFSNPEGFNILALCFKNLCKKEETLASWFKEAKVEDDFLFYPHSITLLDDSIIHPFPEPVAVPYGAYRLVSNESHIRSGRS